MFFRLEISYNSPDSDIAENPVAWLTSETSLIEPSHFKVSVEEVLSELLLCCSCCCVMLDTLNSLKSRSRDISEVGDAATEVDAKDDRSFCDQLCDA